MNQHPATLAEIIAGVRIGNLPLGFQLIGNPAPSLRHGHPFVRFWVRVKKYQADGRHGETLAVEEIRGAYTTLDLAEVSELIEGSIDLHDLLERSELEAYSREGSRDWKAEQAHRAETSAWLWGQGNYLS